MGEINAANEISYRGVPIQLKIMLFVITLITWYVCNENYFRVFSMKGEWEYRTADNKFKLSIVLLSQVDNFLNFEL